LCKYHHMMVHDRGYLIAAARDGTFAFYRPDGTPVPSCPPLPPPDGTIGDCHDAEITPETIIPLWYGERLDLDYAISVCFANAANQADAANRASQHNSAPPPVQVEDNQRKRPENSNFDCSSYVRNLQLPQETRSPFGLR
jgi:hypothetical protein